MKTLIRNEFSKLKRDRTPWFPLILALLPVVTGTAACIVHTGRLTGVPGVA